MSTVSKIIARLVCAQLKARKTELEARMRGEANENKKVIYEVYIATLEELEKEFGCEA